MRDVNDTRFKLVLGRSDWEDQFSVGVTPGQGESMAVVYDDDHQRITLRSRTERIPRQSAAAALCSADRTSAARDQYGSWYWIDPDDPRRIVVRNAGDDGVEPFWPPKQGQAPRQSGGGRRANRDSAFQPEAGPDTAEPPDLGALTITSDHRLVVGARSPDQLLVFDLHAGGPPQRIPWFGEAPFVPVDATPRPDGGFYLLNVPESFDDVDGSTDEPPRLWALDRTFRPDGSVHSPSDASPFRPVDTAHGRRAPASVAGASGAAFGLPVPGEGRPQGIEALPDDSLFVLAVAEEEGDEDPCDSGSTAPPSRVYRYRLADPDGTTLEEAGSINLSDTLEPETDDGGTDADSQDSGDELSSWKDTWRAHDLAFVPDAPTPLQSLHGTLYVVGKDGNQAYAVEVAADTETVNDVSMKQRFLPLRGFSGKALVEADGEVYYDKGDRWFTVTPQRRPRFVERGRIRSAPFDSEIAACTWHRVFLDACIPPEADVRLESRASDRIDHLAEQPWRDEPDFYQRDSGAEIPYYDPFPSGDRKGQGTWEVLLQNAEGRYLQLRLTLEGNGQSSPQIAALRAYFPRFSYLEEYMPDVYQKDEASASFVERFLAITEGTLTDLEGQIAAVQTLFDVRTVPDEYLDWLATWFGASFDPALDARRKRLFLDHAVELFRQRGTMAGLARMLTLVLDPCADESLFTPAGIAGAVGRPEDADDRTARRGGVRLIEQFAARDVPRAALGDARVPEQPAEVRVDEPWVPSDGAQALDRRFRDFLDDRYGSSPGDSTGDDAAVGKSTGAGQTADGSLGGWKTSGKALRFPTLLPAASEENAAQKREDWRVFVRRVIEGPYAAIDAGTVRHVRGDVNEKRADEASRRFRAFLQRRYRQFENVPDGWKRDTNRFEGIMLPETLPGGSALLDWMHFVGAVLPISRAAHRFRVLVPVDPDADPSTQRQRLDLARRVVEQEKPAHTAFEVLPYWAAFRAGVARTGLDTVLGTGSRYAPLLVGDGALAEETVGAAYPKKAADRRVVGRDTAGRDAPPL